MPKTPTTLFIVPSRLAMVIHLLLALAVVGLAFSFAGTLSGLVAALLMGGLLVRVGANRPRGELRVIHPGSGRGDDDHGWTWREGPGSPWRPVRLDCDYLGPWLLGLRLDGRRLWLWPDSSDREALRALRRELISLS